jgi:hypothetical protein
MRELKSAIEDRQAQKLKRLGEDLRDWADNVREQIEEVLQLGEEVLLLAEDFEHAEQAEAAEMNGKYLTDREEVSPAEPRDAAAQKRLWEVSALLTNLEVPS